MIITFIIIGLSVLVSWSALNKTELFYRLDLEPYRVVQLKEYYRVITHAVIHGDWMHLFVNMFVLYSFGGIAEQSFYAYFGTLGYLYYILLYLGGVAFATLPALKKHQNNPNYHAVGASGAVAAVLFSSILFFPDSSIYLFFIPIPIPAYIFGPLYIAYEVYMDKRGGGNVAHDAHYYGAIFGLLLTVILVPELVMQFFSTVFG